MRRSLRTVPLRTVSLRAVAAATCLVALAACGDDDDDTAETPTEQTSGGTDAPGDDDTTDVTLPGGVTLPNGVTLPDGVTLPEGVDEECLDFYQTWATAFAGAFTGNKDAVARLDEAVEAAGDIAPADLQDDFEVLAEGLGEWGQVLAENNYNFMDPDVQEQLSEISTDEFQEASDNVSKWVEEECAPD